MIIIIDYKMGNIGSIANMLKKIGADAKISSDNNEIKKAGGLILSGVGSFDEGIKNLKKCDLIEVIEEKVLKDKTPILGICLGMQLFAQKSEEGILNGLGWIEAEVKKFKSESIKIPHMGWNRIKISKNSNIFKAIEAENRFYFAHSYYIARENKNHELAHTYYGCDFVSAINKENIFGVQFHPEKSHKFGMQLFKNFADIC